MRWKDEGLWTGVTLGLEESTKDQGMEVGPMPLDVLASWREVVKIRIQLVECGWSGLETEWS